MPESAGPPNAAPLSCEATPRALMLVVLVGALVQAGYLLESRDDPTYATPIIDAAVYHDAAVRFANGERMIDDAFWQPPLFPLALGVFYRVIGANVVAARIMLAAMAVVTCVVVAWIGARLFGRPIGLISGFALALYGPFVFFSSQLLPTGLVIFLTAGAIALWIEFLDKGRPVVLAASGGLLRAGDYHGSECGGVGDRRSYDPGLAGVRFGACCFRRGGGGVVYGDGGSAGGRGDDS